MGGQHLSVIHDFTLVGGDLQRGQHIIHTGQTGGSAGGRAMETPLEDIEAGPACYVGALFEDRKIQDQMRCFDAKDTLKGHSLINIDNTT